MSTPPVRHSTRFGTEDALEACGKALWLDPQDRDARDLQERAQGALDEQKIQGWLGEARQLLSGEQVHDAQLTAASGLIDEAIAVNPVHETATALRREVLGLRRQRELDRDDARHVHAVLARARENLELEEFDACIAGCDDALTVSSGSAEARELRQRALAARDERRRNREIRQRAEKAVREAGGVTGAGGGGRGCSGLGGGVGGGELGSGGVGRPRRRQLRRLRRLRPYRTMSKRLRSLQPTSGVLRAPRLSPPQRWRCYSRV